MGYGAFTVVWPYDEIPEIWSYTYLFMEKWAKSKNVFFLFFFSRGLEHCGPFISSDISSIETKRWLLPKFDSKILITWAITLCAPGSSTYESLVTVPKIILRKKEKRFLKKKKYFFFCFFVSWSVNDTRSAWRYCNTRATLGRGAAQAPQDLSHGLNNSLKLMWRHAPRTRD